MEVINGFDYTVEGYEDTAEFAKAILRLVNIKSSRRGIIASFRTFDGTNRIEIITYAEMDGFIKESIGEIIDREQIDILHANYDSLDRGSKAQIAGRENKEVNYTVTWWED
ncbi:hypothetical protein NX029_26220 [Cytobacillus firmus]|nr:hypothetical protein [Cytobacillus firmus]